MARWNFPLDDEVNIVLVGMPGAGKSTVGVLLAKYTARDFIDSDVLIERREGKLLQQILEQSGYLDLRQIEQDVLLSLSPTHSVIATGGSAAYSTVAMEHLRRHGAVVFLDVAYEEVARRVHNFSTRGIACPPGMTLRDVYEERRPLYLRWADVHVMCGSLGHEEVAEEVLRHLGLRSRCGP